ncbi:ABC transporter ATP-binding protein [Oceanobacillus bengalensis]|uniref:ABC transporter ATP-binding protein n=1 Tax=Oceanobacillus bengalensis TaxID=1435466 RepID=A0A494Z6I5_9BACI|nr:ABC transporter ATP-binding protein [Oceanobacillus bengalensis]RKQ17607.1 ABC transporter ATP-binding protein [Oceanobacillus bengalensis]
MLTLKNISVKFKDKVVLDDLSFQAEKGEIIGVAAPNGTGKTTLFNVMANYLKPNAGEVIIDDNYTYKSEKQEIKIRKRLTTFPDQDDLFDELSGIDHLKLYGNMWKGTTKHIPQIVGKLNMGNYVKNKVRTYSLGMRQRLCFAMMAAADSSIMLMDEVMNGLDINNVSLISEYLIEMKKEQKLIFIASHLLENLDLYADRVIFLSEGKIIHEQRFGRGNDDYIKISLDPHQYNRLINEYVIPDNHLYIASHLFCLPLKGMKQAEQMKWVEQLLGLKEKELSIGPLGTVEYYEKHYH